MSNRFIASVNKIKTKGYWSFDVIPKNISTNSPLNLLDLSEIAQRSSVQLRGWDFPHISRQNAENQDMYNANDHIESWVDWNMYKEVWRLYTDGQFACRKAFREDWHPSIESLKYIDCEEVIHILSEFFIFIDNLWFEKIYQDQIELKISLYCTNDRLLKLFNSQKAQLFSEYKCHVNTIDVVRIFSYKEFHDKHLSFALEFAEYIFEQFNWLNMPKKSFQEDQKALLERRL